MITDHEMHRMPWTSHLMTLEEFEQWVASRPEAGRAINIDTCERWRFFDDRPFGLLVLTKTRLADDGCGEGYAAGWCHKEIFRRQHVIADGSGARRRDEACAGGSGMASWRPPRGAG
jgi:hypothetical protein